MKKEKNLGKQEVEYKQKAGTAWSHSYLNQKPWHPLSYPNQRRKWIAEQTHSQREQQAADVAREFAQEQEFFRRTSQMTKKEKEKMEQLQAVSFMYIRPPGYNAEAARAAEIADERKRLGLTTTGASSAAPEGSGDIDSQGNASAGGKEIGKARVKDVFGRTLPTEEEFPALKNGPRLETGAPVRLKPFAIEIRNVMCARCGAFGHQSGDRECSLKDIMMPNEEARLKREDPLNVILAQTTSDEPLKWELKQQPGGISPARGGFRADDPNQQIIPDEDIYDEYGGFLAGGGEDGGLSIPNVLASLSREQRRELTDANVDIRKRSKKKKKKLKHKNDKHEGSDEEQVKQRHRDRRRPVQHGGPRERGVSSSGTDEDHGSHSTDEQQIKRRHRDKRRSANYEARRKRKRTPQRISDDQSSSSSDDEQRREKRAKIRKFVKPGGQRKTETSSDESEDDQRRNGSDKNRKVRRYREKRGWRQERGKSKVSPEKGDYDIRGHKGDEEQRRSHLDKGRSARHRSRRKREVSPEESYDDQRKYGSDHDTVLQKHRDKDKVARSAKQREIFPENTDDKVTGCSSEEEQRRKSELPSRIPARSGGARNRELYSSESDDNQRWQASDGDQRGQKHRDKWELKSSKGSYKRFLIHDRSDDKERRPREHEDPGRQRYGDEGRLGRGDGDRIREVSPPESGNEERKRRNGDNQKRRRH